MAKLRTPKENPDNIEPFLTYPGRWKYCAAQGNGGIRKVPSINSGRQRCRYPQKAGYLPLWYALLYVGNIGNYRRQKFLPPPTDHPLGLFCYLMTPTRYRTT